MDALTPPIVAIIGAGPAGLMAAEKIVASGSEVHVYDAMPSAGRKFLLAGKSGMNLTHSEDFDNFVSRYRERSKELRRYLSQLNAEQIRTWAKDLGIDTFVGSSGRIFPVDMKAAPLLRAWLHRLREHGVRFHMRHQWISGTDNHHILKNTEGHCEIHADAVVFAMGGASWKRLGSDAAWVPFFAQAGIRINPFRPSNCGFLCGWSPYFVQRFAGAALTNVVATVELNDGRLLHRQGQFVITERGVEGSLIYALSAELREQISIKANVSLQLDLLPGKSATRVFDELNVSRGSRSLSSHLRSKLGLHPVHIALLHEVLNDDEMKDIAILAQTVKALPISLHACSPIDEAISSAGGVDFLELDENLMLKKRPGWFCAGEMLDWEAPTGGYLLTACFATGAAAGRGVNKWLDQHRTNTSQNCQIEDGKK